MNKKFFVLLAVTLIFLGFAENSFGEKKRVKKIAARRQTNQLVANLPASDMVVRIDLQRLMNTALPQVLAAKPQMLTDVNNKIDEIKSQTGVDLRQFEQLAVGVNYTQNAPQIDLEPVIFARGKFNAEAFLAMMKIVAKENYREEKVGAKSIYIFDIEKIFPDKKPPVAANKSANPDIIDSMFDKLSKEIAVTVIDTNTMALGTAARVRETAEGKSRVGQEILAMVNQRPNTVMSFAGNMPAGASQLLKFAEADDLGKTIDSIRQIYGSADAADGVAVVAIAAKTTDAAQATELENTVSGLQMLGKSMLGGMNGGDKQVYARMIENAKITRTTNQVMLNLRVPQTDIDVLLGKK